jgi:hypothetical protein
MATFNRSRSRSNVVPGASKSQSSRSSRSRSSSRSSSSRSSSSRNSLNQHFEAQHFKPFIPIRSSRFRNNDSPLPSRVPKRVLRARTKRIRDIVHDFDIKEVGTIVKNLTQDRIITIHNLPVKISKNPEADSILIEFLNPNRKSCVLLEYVPLENMINLHSYYFYTKMNKCIVIPHDWFFREFLMKLATELRVTNITLYDASYKSFAGCNVPSIIFAFAYGTTFYQKYGFRNPEYEKFIQDHRNLTMEEYLENGIGFEAMKRICVSFLNKIDVLHHTVKDTCRMIIDNCKETRRLSTQDVKRLIYYIKYLFPVTNDVWELNI